MTILQTEHSNNYTNNRSQVMWPVIFIAEKSLNTEINCDIILIMVSYVYKQNENLAECLGSQIEWKSQFVWRKL